MIELKAIGSSLVPTAVAVGTLAVWSGINIVDRTDVLVDSMGEKPIVMAASVELVPGHDIIEVRGTATRECKVIDTSAWLEVTENRRTRRVGLGRPDWRSAPGEGDTNIVWQATVLVPRARPGEYMLCAAVEFQCGPSYIPPVKQRFRCSVVTLKRA